MTRPAYPADDPWDDDDEWGANGPWRPAVDRGAPAEAPRADARTDGQGKPTDGWGPIRLAELPEAAAFPLDVLPLPARRLAEAAAASIGCPVDFPALGGLAAASGVIGRSACLSIKPGYFESASLYAAAVGGPSSGKSPALRAALAPVHAIAERLHDEWRPKMDAWKAAKADGRGEEPDLVRLVTSDPTTEALGPILAKNPRGLLVAPDEMTKWVLSMDQYRNGRGGDRPFYLAAWSGEPVYIDRAKFAREPIVVPHPFLTVVGGIVPDLLSALPEGRGRDDGFLARLLFAYPDRGLRRYSERGIPDAVAQDWERVVGSLWSRGMADLGGRPAPRVVEMAPRARREWAAWCRAHYAEQEADDFLESLEGPWGKLEAYMARVSLILHLIELASDPERPDPEDPPELSERTIAHAARLVDYFKSHARRVHAAMGGKADGGGEDARALVRWIRRGPREEFSERDITQNLRRFRDDPAALAEALRRLAERNVIRLKRSKAGASPKGGRPPTREFEVNPGFE
jgi:hypothetical protein